MNKMCTQYNRGKKKKKKRRRLHTIDLAPVLFFLRLSPLTYWINKDECRSRVLSRGGPNNSTSKSLLEDTSTVFLKTTGYARVISYLYPASAISTATCPDLAKVSLKGSGERLRAAFSYYIQGLLRRRGNLRQRFRLAACDVTSRLLSGGRGTPRPYDRSFLPLCWTRLTSLQGRRGLCSSKSEGSTGRSSPSEGRVFLRRPAASGCRGPQGPILAFGWPPFFPPCHARRQLEMSSKASLGLLHGPGPGEQRDGGWRRCAEAAAIEALR